MPHLNLGPEPLALLGREPLCPVTLGQFLLLYPAGKWGCSQPHRVAVRNPKAMWLSK